MPGPFAPPTQEFLKRTEPRSARRTHPISISLIFAGSKSLALAIFVQFRLRLPENLGSFPARQPKIEQVVLLKSREQTIAGQVRELGRCLGFLAPPPRHGPVAAGRHFRLVPKRLADILGFFQSIKPNARSVAENRSEPRLDSGSAPRQLRVMRGPDHRMAVKKETSLPRLPSFSQSSLM